MEPQPQPEHVEPIKHSRLKSFLRGLWEIVQMLVLALVLYFVIDAVIGRVRVQKISMEPTLLPEEILLVNKLAFTFRDMKHGDIITFQYPLDPELAYVKRVIGLPGDEVIVRDRQVYVNSRQLYEPYISAPPEYDGVWQVPPENIFVLGDNRNPSADSHVWGFVPLDHVIGKVFAVYWPIPQIRTIRTPDIFLY